MQSEQPLNSNHLVELFFVTLSSLSTQKLEKQMFLLQSALFFKAIPAFFKKFY